MFQSKQSKLTGATIIAFDCRGCMAEDHRFMWVGQVYDFEKIPITGSRNKTDLVALVRVDKHEAQHGDSRDGFMGHERVVVENGSLQEIRKGLFFLYR